MPVLTFLSDYGLADSYVAEVKGAILSLDPAATIVDLTHLVPAGAVASGAYLREPQFQRFVQARAEKLREQGRPVDLWR